MLLIELTQKIGENIPRKTQRFLVIFQNFQKTHNTHIILTPTRMESHASKIRFFGRSLMEILIKTYFSVLTKVRGTAVFRNTIIKAFNAILQPQQVATLNFKTHASHFVFF